MTKYLHTWGLVLITTMAFSQNDSIQARLTIQEVTISDLRHQYDIQTLDRQITVIDRHEITQAPVQSVSELLQYVAGIDVRNRGVLGMQADISIRGGTFDQTLILIDGLRFSDPQTGHHNMNIPIDLAAIERIEIIKGAGARHYGINAAAGAINIVTRQPAKDHVQAQLVRGSFGYLGLGGAAAFGRQKRRFFVSLRQDVSDGYRYNTAFRGTSGFVRTTLPLRSTAAPQVHIVAGATYRQFGANGFYGSPLAAEQYEATETNMASCRLPVSLKKWTIAPRVYWRRGFDLFKYDRTTNLYNNRHLTQVLGADIQSQYKIAGHTRIGFGIDVNQAKIFSSNLGNRSRTTSAFYSDIQTTVRRFSVMINATILHTTDFGWAKDKFLPLVGYELGYSLSPVWRVGFNGGGTYRVPTFTDQYYSDPASQGNPNLEAEVARHLESFVRYTCRSVSGSAAVFRRLVNNQIDWVRSSDTSKWMADNLTSVRMIGFETQGRLHFAQLLERKRFFIQQASFGYTNLDARINTSDDAFTSRYATNQLRHQFVQGIVLRLPGDIFVDARHRYARRANAKDLETGYHVFDVRLSADYKIIQLFIEGRNITDTDYWEVNQVPLPGRHFMGGFTIRFGRIL